MLTMDRPIRTLLVFAALVGIGACSRFLDVAPNATAIAGCALFASWIFRSRWLAVGVPLLSMAVTDLVLGGYAPLVMASVYACVMLPAVCGRLVGDRDIALRSIGVAIACASVFFLVTNFAVWFAASDGYPGTLSGLIACYANALPFFRMTLAGDVLTVGTLFGGWALAAGMVNARAARTIAA